MPGKSKTAPRLPADAALEPPAALRLEIASRLPAQASLKPAAVALALALLLSACGAQPSAAPSGAGAASVAPAPAATQQSPGGQTSASPGQVSTSATGRAAVSSQSPGASTGQTSTAATGAGQASAGGARTGSGSAQGSVAAASGAGEASVGAGQASDSSSGPSSAAASAGATDGSSAVGAAQGSPASGAGSGQAPSAAASPTPVGSVAVFSGEQLASTAASLHPVSVAGHQLNLPAGFSISVFASGLSAPRFMAFDAAGNLAVAEDGANRVILFPAKSATPKPLISGLNDPTSVAFDQNFIYVAEANAVSRYAYQDGAIAGGKQAIVPNLPAATDHHTRTIVFGPDGKLYLAMGSPCNVCAITNQLYAAVSRYNPDGSGYELFAKGLRNAVGLAFEPGTSLLWATVNGRDSLGDNIPWDLLTTIRQGGDYGFPSCYDDRQRDPQFGTAAGCGGMTLPDSGIQAHSAPLGLAFYTGGQFPAEYKGDIFIANHGSWNRTTPTGYDIVRAHLSNGRVTSVTDFATGWAPPGPGQIISTPHGIGTAGAWGRPVQPVVGPDGSLYVSDDYLGAIYRISYSG